MGGSIGSAKPARPELVDKEPGDEIIGKKVIIKSCEAREHGDNEGCVCGLKGHKVTISRKYDTPWVGTPSYHIKGSNKRVRRSEVILPRKQSVRK